MKHGLLIPLFVLALSSCSHQTITRTVASTNQPDVVLNVKTTEGMTLSATATYLSSSSSFFCTHFGEGFERVPKSFDKNIQIIKNGNSSKIVVAENLNDSCQSELKGLNIKVSHPNINEENAVLGFADSQQNLPLQRIVYVKYASPYGDFYAPQKNQRDILVGPSGVADVEISLVK